LKLKKIFGQTGLVLILCVLIVMQFFQVGKLNSSINSLEDKNSSLITEIGQVKEAYTLFAGDLGEVRKYLLMPTTNYLGFADPALEETSDSDSKNATAENDDNLQIALFKYVDFLSVEQKLERDLAISSQLLKDLFESVTFNSLLDENALTASDLFEDDSGFSISISNDSEKILYYNLSKETGELIFKSPLEEIKIVSEDLATIESDFKKYLDANLKSILDFSTKIKNVSLSIDTAVNSVEAQEALKVANARIDDKYLIYNNSNEVIAEISVDPKSMEISLIDMAKQDVKLIVKDIASELVPFIKTLDTRTLIDIKVDEAKKNVENTLNDTGFKLLLAENSLSIAELREDEDRFYYDILNREAKHLSSIVIEKTTGVINIVDPNGTNSENILFFDPEFKKKTLDLPEDIPEFDDSLSHADGTFNILIAGKHGNLIDTMIFAHLDEAKREVRMISIPRDLHYNGRKINSFAFYYGLPELKKVLSDITGYELDKYVLIDMYAFIDVVDLIGGIDITLESAVIDPTYRTVDNGVEGTLHYEPGDYHLGGVEALRLARTRHTSSDFARAERQQMILESLQAKARNFGFGDADTFYNIAKSILEQTETDIGLDEAVAYYFRYQNYEIVSNDVMSSGNILYVPDYITTEQCNALISAAAAAGQARPGCENENHAYTLLPMDNNWDVIKWFFKDKFES
jgi:LCP family protein required for cell wall assembly